jgi:hypothetical protein
MNTPWKYLLTLSDLELKLPTVRNDFQPIRTETVAHHKATAFSQVDNEKEAKIIIVKATAFNFRFCFNNQYKKLSPQENARVAEIVYDDPIKTLPHIWQPPRFVIFPGYGINTNLTIIDISWDKSYRKRFNNFSVRKSLQEKLRKIILSKQQYSQKKFAM